MNALPAASPAPEEITIAVAAEDIPLGEPHSAWRDPVCRAVCRLLGAPVASDMAGTRVSVGADVLDIWPEHGGDAATYLLPDEGIPADVVHRDIARPVVERAGQAEEGA